MRLTEHVPQFTPKAKQTTPIKITVKELFTLQPGQSNSPAMPTPKDWNVLGKHKELNTIEGLQLKAALSYTWTLLLQLRPNLGWTVYGQTVYVSRTPCLKKKEP